MKAKKTENRNQADRMSKSRANNQEVQEAEKGASQTNPTKNIETRGIKAREDSKPAKESAKQKAKPEKNEAGGGASAPLIPPSLNRESINFRISEASRRLQAMGSDLTNAHADALYSVVSVLDGQSGAGVELAAGMVVVGVDPLSAYALLGMLAVIGEVNFRDGFAFRDAKKVA